MEELNTTDSAQPICYGLSVSYDILTESEYGSTGDSVLDSHKAKLRTHIDSIINETEEINNNGTPTGFLCIMALIAYLAELVYGDVDGKTCLMVDDMIDTAGTITEASKLLVKEGAEKVYVCAAHGVFSGPAFQRLADAPIEEVIVTNTIPLKAANVPSKIKQLSVANLLGEAISRIHDDESVSSLFGFEKTYIS